MTRTSTGETRSDARPRGKTRQRLLDAGLTLFAHKGVDGVTVSELEEAVGLKAGSGSFYRHFADRNALLEAIIEREIERAGRRRAEEQGALKDRETDVREALARQFRLTLTGLRENAELINLLSRATDHFPALMNQLRRAFVEQATETVAEAYELRARRGELINADPAMLSAVVQSALYGYFSAETVFGASEDHDAYEQAFIETLVAMATGGPG